MACSKPAMAARRFRLSNAIGLFLVQDQAAANPNGGLINRHNIASLFDRLLPALPSLTNTHHRTYHTHTHQRAQKGVKTKLPTTSVLSSPAIGLNGISGIYYQETPTAFSTEQNKGPGSTQDAKLASDTSSQNEILQTLEEENTESLTVFQRFKKTYKEYGKVLIGVHVATSIVWFGTFYYAAYSGIDVTPLLEKMGVSETIINLYKKPGVGNAAVAYLLYKIATPARYTVTIGGTHQTVKWMRKIGYMPPVPEGDKIRDLVKDSRVQMKEKYSDMKDDLKEKMDDIKVDIKDKYDDVKVDIKEKYGEVKVDMKEKIGDVKVDLKGKYGDVKGDLKGKMSEMKDEFKDKLKGRDSTKDSKK